MTCIERLFGDQQSLRWTGSEWSPGPFRSDKDLLPSEVCLLLARRPRLKGTETTVWTLTLCRKRCLVPFVGGIDRS